MGVINNLKMFQTTIRKQYKLRETRFLKENTKLCKCLLWTWDFGRDDGGSKLFWNVGILLSNDTKQHHNGKQ